MQRLLILVLVITIASGLTAVGIKATDYLTAGEGVCPADMVLVEAVPGVMCIDKAEARAATACLHLVPQSPQATEGNIALPTCTATGDGESEPWRYVTREQAALLCARSGKRLPTAAEWYQVALLSSLDACVLASNGPDAATVSDCRTPSGVVHLPGNVWEWVSDDIRDSTYDGVTLPPSGYVASVDRAGVATVTSTTSVELFGSDYARFADAGVYGMVRGGYYGSGEDGGIYALQANIAPTFASAGIGFRCVR